MAGGRSPWRALRPVFLAGAATITWLTLSSTAASADALPDTASLLGGVTTSVSSVTEKLPVSESAAPAIAEAAAPAQSPGLLQPIVGEVSATADSIVTAVPLVTQVVPADTVSAISVPVAGVVDAAAAEVVETVVPPVAEALPVLNRVLEPVAGLVAGAPALPVPLPESPAAALLGEGSASAANSPVDGVRASALPVAETGSIAEVEADAQADAPSESVSRRPAPSPVASDATVSMPLATRSEPGTRSPSPIPAQAPPATGSGAGGSGSASSSGSAAWLNPFGFDLPMTGALSVGERSAHAPAPVSFDPGSSPD
ncbi:hypothetical protein [Pseudarthrobacter phenanthrenivorans]|uniref:hypothetical protein n=1 Tax=Pseudarthrobacter phenanthrenivorans TaxID=361575 RepID=UPI0009D794F7|nr:hypothetical protein [Pseudarthrobacter phenanthrenivorans]